MKRWRGAGAGVLATCALMALAVSAGASTGVAPSSLCGKAAFLSSPVSFPSWLRTGLEFFNHTLSADAKAHHALCYAAITTPETSPLYLYNVGWYVFPSHAAAVADLEGFNVHKLYTTVTSLKGAAGFPKPNYLLTGTDDGASTIVITFADGPTVTSAFVSGGGTLAQALGLAHWAVRDLQSLHAGDR